MSEGILGGAAAEHELYQFASDGIFTIDLGELVDRILKTKRIGGFAADQQAQMRSSVIRWVRQYQAGFPPQDENLDWLNVGALLKPQTDLFLWRKEHFRIRVRPDVVVGVDETLVAVEFSTAKNPDSISAARFALNHHALARERLRRPDWHQYRSVATRVEMLALGYGFTVRLDAEQAEQWRMAIGTVAESLVSGQYQANPGEYCSACPWQIPCLFNSEPVEGEGF